ncbi:MAG: glyoxylate/hydroxypyruvate reductase A [Alphaproteobacteria bacterium]|nr:glyoxylate/hydroxypyruvate reductase A [Alphaproteobacteria bacterium]
MALLFISNMDEPEAWRRELAARIDGLDFRLWPETGPVEEIDFALVWKPKPGLLAGFPRLKLIQSLGMGVDHIFEDPELPAGVPVARIVDPDMASQMSAWVLLEVLRHHRMADAYAAQQRDHVWRMRGLPDASQTTVGIMGLGVLGADAARKLAHVGFRVTGWSRSAKSIEGVTCFHGGLGFVEFLAGADILVCLLPLTAETEAIINAETLAVLPEGAFVINCARGGHLVEEDLLAAIERGHVAGAALDVFRSEPLPDDHPFWDHPKIRVYPHVAAITNPRTAADQVADNYRRMVAGQPFLNLVDPARGY